MTPDVALRVHRKTRHIEGWFAREAAMLFAWIDDIQERRSLVGDVFEIGVHHGKSAVLLGAMVRPDLERLAVCDIFESQSANVSASGYGNRSVFDANMNLLLPEGVKPRVFAEPSRNLTTRKIGATYRFFHIDGGHDAQEAMGDLNLAADSTIREGVIAIDDAFRPEWPGVTEAIVRFLQSNPSFCPIVVGFNKLILVRRVCAEMYAEHIDSADELDRYCIAYPWHLKKLLFMGFPLRIFYVPSAAARKPFRTGLIALYRRHKLLRASLMRPIVSVARRVVR